MVIVTHEMGLAMEAYGRVIFMGKGQIVEEGRVEHLFKNPIHDRDKLFLSQILWRTAGRPMVPFSFAASLS